MVDEVVQRHFEEILGPQGLLVAPGKRSPFSRDASGICSPPAIVLLPQTTSQIVKIVRLAHENRISLTIRGAGSGLDGGAVAKGGDLLLSLERMNHIVEISPEDMMAVVQPGVITAQVNAHLKPLGLFYPVDPASQARCTIGGNVATAAHGLRGTKYGVNDNYLLGLEAVIAPGEIIRCGAKTLKCATGYRLTGLLAGSGGRIGIITEIILRLLPRPRAEVSIMAIFDAVSQAQQAKRVLGKKHIWPSRLELMDAWSARKSGPEAFHVNLSPGQLLLLVELDGSASVVKKDVQITLQILAQANGKRARAAKDQREAEEWWRARGALLSTLIEEEDVAILSTVILPGSRTTQFFEKVAGAASEKSVLHTIYGHLGEERWHPMFLIRKGATTEQRALLQLAEAVHKIAASLGGRSLRPYAIGFDTAASPTPPRDPGQKELWAALKARFDPQGIFRALG